MPPLGPRLPWKRFWCPRDGRYNTDNDGFVRRPESWAHAEHWEPTDSVRLAQIPCLVLLGEPGIGKSCALVDMVERTQGNLMPDEELLSVDLRFCGELAEVFTKPSFQAWRSGEQRLCLFIDSLDERRNIHDASHLLGALSEGPLDRLRLRVACRTGDLPLLFGDALIGWWGKPQSVAHLELLPLARDDVHLAAQAADIDAPAFLAEVLHRNVVQLATRPITLQFLLELFRAGRSLAKTRWELYRSGCDHLVREHSLTRRDHRESGRLNVDARLAVARRLAAISVFAQKSVFYLERPLAGLPLDALDLQQLAGERVGDIVPPFVITAELVKEVITQTGLFTARGEGCFGWGHLTYAEFLAAEFLSERIPDHEDLRPLLTPPELARQVPYALRGVASWLSSRNEGLFTALLADDVSVLLHADLKGDSDVQRTAIITRLLDRVAAAEILDPDVSAATYARLNHPGLAEQLRPWIEDGGAYFMARRVALDIAESCRAVELLPSLLQVACDTDDEGHIRARALAVLTELAGDDFREKVRPLLDSPSDPNDELRGYVLSFLWPALDPAELIRHLKPPNDPSYLGKYYIFINYELVPQLTDDQLPWMLDWLEAYELGAEGRTGFIERAAGMLRRRAWVAMYRSDVLGRLVRIVGGRIHRGEDAFGGLPFPDLEPSPAVLLEDQGRRRTLVSAMVESELFPQFGLCLSDPGGLIRSDDLGWLLHAFERAGDELIAERWMELVVNRMCERGNRDEDIDAVVALADRHPRLRAQLRWLLGSIELASPEAEKLRKQHEATERRIEKLRDFEAREGSDLPPLERMQHVLGRSEGGDWTALSGLIAALRLDGLGRPWMFECADPSQLPGWPNASIETRERVLAVARAFLTRGEPATENGATSSRDAYKFLRLLAARDRTWLEKQPAEFWQRWSPTVIAYPIRDGAEEHVALLRWARRHASDEFRRELATRTRKEVHQGYLSTARHLGACWDEEIGALLLADAHDPSNTGKGLAELLDLLLNRNVDGARVLCETLLTHASADPARARASAQALLIADIEHSWKSLLASFSTNPELAQEVLDELHRKDIAAMAGRCSASRIEDVYAWIASTPMNNPEHVEALKTALREQLTKRGTLAGLEAITRLRDAFPGDTLLLLAYAMARDALSRQGWTPWSLGDVLLLRRDRSASGSSNPRKELSVELCELFRTPERAWVWIRHSPVPGIGSHELPLPGASNSLLDWMDALVDKLVARGVDADEICIRLISEFPDCPKTIGRIVALWRAAFEARGSKGSPLTLPPAEKATGA